MPVNHDNTKKQMKNSINNIRNHQDLSGFLEEFHGFDFIFSFKDIATDLTDKVINLIDNNSLDVHDIGNIFLDEKYSSMFNKQLLEKLPDFLQEKFDNYRKTNKQDQKAIINALESTNKQLGKTVRVLKEDLKFKSAALKEGKSIGEKSIKGKYKSSKVARLETFKKELDDKYVELIESLNIEKSKKKESMDRYPCE